MRLAILLVIGSVTTGCFLSHSDGSAVSGDRPTLLDLGVAAHDLGVADAMPIAVDGGGRACTPTSPCGMHEYCVYPTGDECGAAGLPGVCTPAPWSCPALPRDPVCGCDGVTYENFCPAISGGTSIASMGACESCTIRWNALPWCPVDPASFVGLPCSSEGAACGTACCEPGPPIVCRGGTWIAAVPPDCRGVRCAGPRPCGVGACAANRVCLHPSIDVVLPDRCVLPPFAVSTCGDVPPGWLVDDTASCSLCSCSETDHVEVALSCPCCDR